jgi:hypothetical protein
MQPTQDVETMPMTDAEIYALDHEVIEPPTDADDYPHPCEECGVEITSGKLCEPCWDHIFQVSIKN